MTDKNTIVSYDFIKLTKKSPIIRPSWHEPVLRFVGNIIPLFEITIKINWSDKSLGYKENRTITVNQHIDGRIEYNISQIAHIIFCGLNSPKNKILDKIDKFETSWVQHDKIYEILESLVGGRTSTTRKALNQFKKDDFVIKLNTFFINNRYDVFKRCIIDDVKLTKFFDHEHTRMIIQEDAYFKNVFGNDVSVLSVSELLDEMPENHRQWMVINTLLHSREELTESSLKRQRND